MLAFHNLTICLLLKATGFKSITFSFWLICCLVGLTVHSVNNYKASETRLAQIIQKLKNEGIHPKQWRLDTFQKLMCPKVRFVGHFAVQWNRYHFPFFPWIISLDNLAILFGLRHGSFYGTVFVRGTVFNSNLDFFFPPLFSLYCYSCFICLLFHSESFLQEWCLVLKINITHHTWHRYINDFVVIHFILRYQAKNDDYFPSIR